MLSIVAMAGLVSACATGSSSCIAVVPYDRATQLAALAELDGLPPNSILARFVEDYGDLRARLRAICEASR